MQDTNFGLHLTLDLLENDVSRLRSMELVYNFLLEFPGAIGMESVTRPYVFPYEGRVPADKGITGFVVIAESHVSAHTFPEKDYCFVDVFSCKHFDAELATKYVVDVFCSGKWTKKCLVRGEGFPR